MKPPRKVLPKNSVHYQGLVCMYMANRGMTLAEAEAEANKQFPRSYPEDDERNPHNDHSD
jgi:hypothetical protein